MMIVHPRYCETTYLVGLLEALPPRHGETLRAWCDRTATALEGDADVLGELFEDAARAHGQHFHLRQPLLDSTFLFQ